ncbi:hypothetical protein Acr_22g0000020 [Actinidia rufa]|uniref:Endonuclease/exonuclease/phosphatase domain-containing protein n=1 Tax=Actinidia rufa TaxID=165716 RepID=A0A7J0GIQ9_9ERIC|nr:hypothetical protein Acr_22g0000020 [Actinidia rufa]
MEARGRDKSQAPMFRMCVGSQSWALAAPSRSLDANLDLRIEEKNKHKSKYNGSSSKLEEDPILAAALAKPGQSTGEGAISNISCKHVEIDGRSIAVMINNGSSGSTESDSVMPDNVDVDNESLGRLRAALEQESEGDPSESEDASQTLGDGDSISSSGVRQNAQAKSEIAQGESLDAEKTVARENANQGIRKSYASLFEKNRLPSNGSKLEFYNLEEGPIKLGEEDIQLSACPWERCLVGYFGGRFPALGMTRKKILENGPYMIYGSPLLLKQMDKYFRFGKEAISTFPVWVQLRGVPLTFWNPVIFGKICSKLGKPIHMDKLTTQKERTTYARCLVEIDMAKDLVHSVQLHMPEGDEHEQKIFYENLPKYCSHCRMVGHTKETCKSKSLPSKKTVVQVAESTVQVPKEDAVQLTGMGGNSGAIVVQLAETTMQRPKEATVQLSGVGGKSGALSTKEWVMKMAIHPIDNTISQPQSNNPETEANNNIVPSKNLAGTSESPVTEEDIATPTDPCHGDTGPDINRDPNPEILEISLDPVTAPNPKQPPDQTPKQIGGEIYIQQANQITSGELKSKLHQLSKSQGSTAHGNLKKGHVSVPRRQGNAALAKPPDKASSSSIIPPLLEKDGERRKKKDKVNQGKGLNMPLKQGEVRNHLRRKKVAIMGIMETKLNHHTLEGIARTKFVGWRVANNFSHHPNGRILILWKEELVRLDIIETTDQNSWILLGDFNNVLNNDERINGQPVTMYETREFKDCCYDLGLSDLRSSGMFHTWSNNKIWCKLDRAMVNTAWTQKGLSGQAHFDTPGIHSDHSPCTISVMGENDRGPNPFKFFNMWTRHEDFQNIVSNTWGMHVVGSAMFRLCKKLKSLKEPLKSLNKHHFSHISERVKAAEVELAHAQQQLHDNTIDTLLQSRVLELRSRALKLAEAEASYCSQLAKAKYLKNCDRGSKFFHDLIKSRQTKSIISSITLGNGSRSNSSKQISDAFVQFYESLLGTKEDCSGLNSEIVSSGRRLNPSQADNLICPVTEEEIKKALFSIGQDKAPVAASRLSIAQFSPFIDKISGYISAWAGASLSYAGRTELIKSVLQGVECFWLSILPIPVGAKKDSLWVQWVHQIYLNRRSFWEYKNRHEDSPLLKQVVTLRDELIEAEGSLENAVQRLNQWAPNGEFQSKLAYEFFRPKGATVTWPKLVWHNSITPKTLFYPMARSKRPTLDQRQTPGFY